MQLIPVHPTDQPQPLLQKTEAGHNTSCVVSAKLSPCTICGTDAKIQQHISLVSPNACQYLGITSLTCVRFILYLQIVSTICTYAIAAKG
jgi:hypothetical protein